MITCGTEIDLKQFIVKSRVRSKCKVHIGHRKSPLRLVIYTLDKWCECSTYYLTNFIVNGLVLKVRFPSCTWTFLFLLLNYNSEVQTFCILRYLIRVYKDSLLAFGHFHSEFNSQFWSTLGYLLRAYIWPLANN